MTLVVCFSNRRQKEGYDRIDFKEKRSILHLSPYSVFERRFISREELDRICDNRPFFMVKYDGHACVVNSVLLEKVRSRAEKMILSGKEYRPQSRSWMNAVISGMFSGK